MKNAIILNQLKIEYNADISNMKGIIAHSLRVKKEDIYDFEILKKSIDARKKPDIYYIYKVRVIFEENKSHLISKVLKNSNVTEDNLVEYVIPQAGDVSLNKPPVIIGMGPAGLFAGYILAQAGFKPIVLERGRDVASRHEDVTHFWETGELNPESNVQFGEGGAGTFSDGKLNTLVKDKFGRNSYVLHTFYKFGASENILYDAKPHIGTDVLMQVVANMRNEIIRLGGQVLFESKVSGLDFDEAHNLQGLYYNESNYIATDVAILAIGHSARDTFRMLHDLDIDMKAKEFAVGFRVEHPQSMIDISQYGKEYKDLPVANYKLTANLDNSRGVYSFC
ncbi:MAG: FAD-dependent oxidoreductase, partial [Lachnospiraceae bacterium]|nr:FAD-dependent oxidoreductase [Lachnospiraceae bacterium]